MGHNTEKEQWINEVMGSLDGISRPQPNGLMYKKVMARLQQEQPQVNRTIRLKIASLAAAAVLLLVLNIASVAHYSKNTSTQTRQSVSQVVNEGISALSEGSF